MGALVADTECDGEPAEVVGEQIIQNEPETDVESKHTANTPKMIQTQYSSWSEFHAALDAHATATFQIYATRTSQSIDAKNQELEANRAKAKGSNTWLYDKSCGEYFKKTLACTHNWKIRDRGGGERPAQLTRALGCLARVQATVKRTVDREKRVSFCVQVTSQSTLHNHLVDEAIWRCYAEIRKVSDPAIIAKVAEYSQQGSMFFSIVQFVRNATEREVTRKDVRNMIADIRRSGVQVPENERVRRLLEAFANKKLGNVANIETRENGNASCIVFQTAQMRSCFADFPEVLCVDVTHGTNRLRYKLFSFMCTDAFGQGRFVQHALIDHETGDNMRDALRIFKENNPLWDRIRVVLVDKDMTEILAIAEAFPQATILLCHFHVVKYLDLKLYSFKVGDAYPQLCTILKSMMYASSEELYIQRRDLMYSILDRLEGTQGAEHPFHTYFAKNWDSCRQKWLSCYRDHLPHFGNNTNNRIESAWGKLKPSLKPEMTMDACIGIVIASQLLVESEGRVQAARRAVTIATDHNYDQEMHDVLAMTTRYASRQVAIQYARGKRAARLGQFITAGEDAPVTLHSQVNLVSSSHDVRVCLGEMYMLDPETRGGKQTLVDGTQWSCSCAFHMTMRLPCAHAIKIRAMRGIFPLIPSHLIAQRWRIHSLGPKVILDASVDDGGLRVRSRPKKRAPMTGSDKYCSLRPLLAQISDAASALGSERFLLVQQQLTHFATLLDKNRVPLVTDPSLTPGMLQPPSDLNLRQLTASSAAPCLVAAQDVSKQMTTDERSAPGGDKGIQQPTEDVQILTMTQVNHLQQSREYTIQQQHVDVMATFQLPHPQTVRGKVCRPKKRKFLPSAAPRSTVDEAVLAMADGAAPPTLKAICTHLDGPVSYERSASFINRVRVHAFLDESDEIVKAVPAATARTPPDEITFILSDHLIQICKKKIQAEIQRLRNARASGAVLKRVVDVDECEDLRETVAIRISLSFETSRRSSAVHQSWVYTCREIDSMAALHSYRRQLAQLEDAMGWCASLAFAGKDSLPGVNVVKLLQTIPLSYQIQVGDHFALIGELFTFAGEEWLNDVCITMSLQQLVVQYPGIMVNPASHIVLPSYCSIPVDWWAVLKARLLFVPVNIEGKHWTLITVDVQEETIILFDPLQCGSTYDAIKKQCVPVIQDGLRSTGRVRSPFRVRLLATITQEDWYNCGVHVIHVARSLTYGHTPNQLTISALEHLRFELFGGLVASTEI